MSKRDQLKEQYMRERRALYQSLPQEKLLEMVLTRMLPKDEDIAKDMTDEELEAEIDVMSTVQREKGQRIGRVTTNVYVVSENLPQYGQIAEGSLHSSYYLLAKKGDLVRYMNKAWYFEDMVDGSYDTIESRFVEEVLITGKVKCKLWQVEMCFDFDDQDVTIISDNDFHKYITVIADKGDPVTKVNEEENDLWVTKTGVFISSEFVEWD